MLEPTILKDLLSGGWTQLSFAPFREGIAISSLLESSPAIAVLRYDPGARVPLHEHTGAETILVLDGSQSDEKGTYVKGDMVINLAGSRHSVWSDDGCVVLLHWAEPVRFIDADTD
jgi:anti-sigma factor ChrR (cupin superfamily)